MFKTLAVLLPVIALFAGIYKVHREFAAPKGKLTLAEIVQFVNSKKAGWEAVNYEELGHPKPRLGLLEGHLENYEKLGFKAKLFSANDLTATPDSFDSRNQWPNCQSLFNIRDQAGCGSCWAFAASSVFSDRLCIGSGQRVQTLMSPQDTLSCCFSCGNGCDGGFPNAAWMWYMNAGAVSGDGYKNVQWCQPYTIPRDGKSYPTPGCSRTCVDQRTYYFDNKTRADSGYTLQGEEAMKADLSRHGSIVASFTVYDDFLAYKGGIYRHLTGGIAGGHAVRIVGYGVENGTKYWTVANSWSTNWGEKGYFRILRGTNECGIEADAMSGLVNA